jgi:hypothetical protein
MVLNSFPLDHVQVSTEGLTEAGLYQVKKATPFAVWGILVKRDSFSLGCMAVDVGMNSLVPTFSRSFQEWNHKTYLIHVSFEGAPVIIELGLDVIDESSQVLRVALERFDIKLVWPFLIPTLL